MKPKALLALVCVGTLLSLSFGSVQGEAMGGMDRSMNSLRQGDHEEARVHLQSAWSLWNSSSENRSLSSIDTIRREFSLALRSIGERDDLEAARALGALGPLLRGSVFEIVKEDLSHGRSPTLDPSPLLEVLDRSTAHEVEELLERGDSDSLRSAGALLAEGLSKALPLRVERELEEWEKNESVPLERSYRSSLALAWVRGFSEIWEERKKDTIEEKLEELVEYSLSGDLSKAKEELEEARVLLRSHPSDPISRLSRAVESLLHEYDEYVVEGSVVDEEGFEEILNVSIPEVEEALAQALPLLRERDSDLALEVEEHVHDLLLLVRSVAPNSHVRALGEDLLRDLGASPSRPSGSTEEGFALLKERLKRIAELVQRGERSEALEESRRAYLEVYSPLLEGTIASRDPSLNRRIERLLTQDLRESIERGDSPEKIRETTLTIESLVAEGLKKGSAPLGGATAFSQSLLIISREGFEAILILAAIVTYLVRMGHRDRVRDVAWGTGIALLATVGLWILVQTLFDLSGSAREVLEGVTALLAVAVLFYVSFWLIQKAEIRRWNRFIQGKVKGALQSPRSWVLGGVAFLAVFREGFETVLFYQALLLSSPRAEGPILLGFGMGILVLGAISFAFYRLGARIPLRPFFVATSALLYILAVSFAGAGVHELQEAGVVPTTSVVWLEPWQEGLGGSFLEEFLGFHATVETLLAQGLLILLAMAALLYTFVWEPSRSEGRSKEPAA